MTPAIITFSFDDGDPLDLEIACLLKKYDLSATFYLPIMNIEGRSTLGPDQIIELKNMGFEIGAHGYHHYYLDRIPASDVHDEIRSGKERLEQILDQEITCFCYPGGRTPSVAVAAVRDLGFAYARTIQECRFTVKDPLLAPTTNHIGNHSQRHYIKQALLSRDPAYIAYFLRHGLWSLDWLDYSLANLDYAIKTGGICHLWGHAFEIERDHEWERLSILFENIQSVQKRGLVVTRVNSRSLHGSPI